MAEVIQHEPSSGDYDPCVNLIEESRISKDRQAQGESGGRAFGEEAEPLEQNQPRSAPEVDVVQPIERCGLMRYESPITKYRENGWRRKDPREAKK